jgi:hypothetical protein
MHWLHYSQGKSIHSWITGWIDPTDNPNVVRRKVPAANSKQAPLSQPISLVTTYCFYLFDINCFLLKKQEEKLYCYSLTQQLQQISFSLHSQTEKSVFGTRMLGIYSGNNEIIFLLKKHGLKCAAESIQSERVLQKWKVYCNSTQEIPVQSAFKPDKNL